MKDNVNDIPQIMLVNFILHGTSKELQLLLFSLPFKANDRSASSNLKGKALVFASLCSHDMQIMMILMVIKICSNISLSTRLQLYHEKSSKYNNKRKKFNPKLLII